MRYLSAICLGQAVFTLGLILAATGRAAEPGTPFSELQPLGLPACLQRVLDYNEAIQIRALEWLASQKRWKAAKGIFEPALVGTVERNENQRKNTAEQLLSQGFRQLDVFDEKNNIYSSGLEFLAPTGAKARLGYSLRDLQNNYQLQFPNRPSPEFESFAGLSLTQPLLKNGGVPATLAAIRLAAGESDLAYQEYRRQMMMVVSRAEAAYWELYYTQEQYQIRSNSVQIAEALLRDNRLRLQTGKGSELEVLRAEAGVSLRQARLQDARQKWVEAMNQLTGLFSGAGAYTNAQVWATDRPAITEAKVNFITSMQEAMEQNPDYLSQRRQVFQENLRVAYAKNQRLPQLDLKASYGLNGLGDSVASSWDDVTSTDFKNWSIGAELRIPLGGGVKERNELAAAKLRKQEALLGLKSAEVQIATALEVAINRVTGSRESVTNYYKVADFNQQVLENELARLEAGKSDSRRVLEVEDSLAEAKSAALESLINYQKALIEWGLIKGSALKARNLELTQNQLGAKTASVLRGGGWTDLSYQDLEFFSRRSPPPPPPAP